MEEEEEEKGRKRAWRRKMGRDRKVVSIFRDKKRMEMHRREKKRKKKRQETNDGAVMGPFGGQRDGRAF